MWTLDNVFPWLFSRKKTETEEPIPLVEDTQNKVSESLEIHTSDRTNRTDFWPDSSPLLEVRGEVYLSLDSFSRYLDFLPSSTGHKSTEIVPRWSDVMDKIDYICNKEKSPISNLSVDGIFYTPHDSYEYMISKGEISREITLHEIKTILEATTYEEIDSKSRYFLALLHAVRLLDKHDRWLH